MQVTETSAEGLAHEFKVVIGAQDLDDRLMARLEEVKGQINLKGFRPGKVPISYLKKTYGKNVMGEVIQEAVSKTTQDTLDERELRPAQQPKIDLPEEMEPIFDGQADLEFTIAVEVIPNFDPIDFSTVKLERLVAEVSDENVDEALESLAAQQQSFKAKGATAKAKDGDRVTIDFVGSIDGVEFDGGKGEDTPLVIGSGQFIPGFEEQLIGATTNDAVEIDVTFPANYTAPDLAGKDAVFKVNVKEVAGPEKTEIDDELAKQFGFDDLEKLNEAMRGRIADELGAHTRERLKRALLDELDERHDFELPKGMVEGEFDQIWQQVQEAAAQDESEDAPEEEDRDEYRTIAERRVRLGLVVAEIGNRNNISVTQEELSRAMAEQARQFPGQEAEIYKFYQENPAGMERLRAPIYEDKVVDFIVEMAEITDRTVSREELTADPDDEEQMKEAKSRKPAKKKATAKKKAAAKPKAEAKAKTETKAKAKPKTETKAKTKTAAKKKATTKKKAAAKKKD